MLGLVGHVPSDAEHFVVTKMTSQIFEKNQVEAGKPSARTVGVATKRHEEMPRSTRTMVARL